MPRRVAREAIFNVGEKWGGDALDRSSSCREVAFGAQDKFRGLISGSGPSVFLVHGAGGNVSQMADLADQIVVRQHQAILIDTSGAQALSDEPPGVVEVAMAICAAAENTGQPYAVIAHSFGALAACVAMELGLKAQRLAFIAPLRSRDWENRDERRARSSRPPADSDAAAEGPLSERGPASSRAPRPSVRLRPLLIVHDRFDRTIPVAEAEAMANTWPGCTLVLTEGYGHTRILSEPSVVEQVTEFITRQPG